MAEAAVPDVPVLQLLLAHKVECLGLKRIIIFCVTFCVAKTQFNEIIGY